MASTFKEHDIQAAYFQWVEWKAIQCGLYLNIFAIPNAAKRSVGAANWMITEGLKAGVPDIFIAVPLVMPGVFHGGAFLETKTEKGQLTKRQADWATRLEQVGYYYAICRSVEELRDHTEGYINKVLEVVERKNGEEKNGH